MAEPPPSARPSPLLTVGEEIVRIIAPVSACMLLVVLLVSALPPPSPLLSPPSPPSPSSSPFWNNLETALLASLLFVAAVTAATFLLLLLFYLRCTPCLLSYTAISASLLLLLGAPLALSAAAALRLPLDAPTFAVLLLNLAALGPAAVSARGFPIAVTQAVLVLVAALVAYCFSALPEWTAWALLAAMAVYDLAAVLLPVGPLRLLVELAVSRDEDLPALVYEARPVDPPAGAGALRVWREERSHPIRGASSPVEPLLEDRRGGDAIAGGAAAEDAGGADGIGLGASGAIKLGLGDFIFYSVLVGRAATYDYMTVYACYLAIIAGLGITLALLAFYRKALPALPVSIALGLLFYLVTRVFLEVFVMQCSINLLMF